MAKSKAAKPIKAKKSRVLKYDASEMLKLWEKGLSIRQISETMKPSPSKVFVHRTLTGKFPKQYEQGQKERAAAREKEKGDHAG